MKCSKTAAILVVLILSIAVCSQAGIMSNKLPSGQTLVFISPPMDMSCSSLDFDLVYDVSELIYNNDYAFFGTPCNTPMGSLVSNDTVNGVLKFTVSWLSEIQGIDFLQITFLETNPVADGMSDFVFENVTILNSSGTSIYGSVPAQGNDFLDIVPEPATVLLLGIGCIILRRKL